MYLKKINFWFLSSLLVSIFVAIPIVTVFTSFFEDTSNYYQILKDTFLFEYIFNSLVLLISVLVLTFLIGTSTAVLVPIKKVKTKTLISKTSELKMYSNKKVSFRI